MSSFSDVQPPMQPRFGNAFAQQKHLQRTKELESQQRVEIDEQRFGFDSISEQWDTADPAQSVEEEIVDEDLPGSPMTTFSSIIRYAGVDSDLRTKIVNKETKKQGKWPKSLTKKNLASLSNQNGKKGIRHMASKVMKFVGIGRKHQEDDQNGHILRWTQEQYDLHEDAYEYCHEEEGEQEDDFAKGKADCSHITPPTPDIENAYLNLALEKDGYHDEIGPDQESFYSSDDAPEPTRHHPYSTYHAEPEPRNGGHFTSTWPFQCPVRNAHQPTSSVESLDASSSRYVGAIGNEGMILGGTTLVPSRDGGYATTGRVVCVDVPARFDSAEQTGDF